MAEKITFTLHQDSGEKAEFHGERAEQKLTIASEEYVELGSPDTLEVTLKPKKS